MAFGIIYLDVLRVICCYIPSLLLYFSLSLPNDLKMYPLKINAAEKIIANIICLSGTWNAKPIRKEINAPAALKGIQTLIASRYLF